MFKYLDVDEPLVVVMSPQCTGLAGWGRFNAMMNPETHHRTLRTSYALGDVCARVATQQLETGRCYLNEQPQGSDLYRRPGWRAIREVSVQCVMHQCCTGLRGHIGKTLRKATEWWASHELLVARFRPLRCDGRHLHGQVAGADTKPLQIWTWVLARILASGIVDLINHQLHSPTR